MLTEFQIEEEVKSRRLTTASLAGKRTLRWLAEANIKKKRKMRKKNEVRRRK